MSRAYVTVLEEALAVRERLERQAQADLATLLAGLLLVEAPPEP